MQTCKWCANKNKQTRHHSRAVVVPPSSTRTRITYGRHSNRNVSRIREEGGTTALEWSMIPNCTLCGALCTRSFLVHFLTQIKYTQTQVRGAAISSHGMKDMAFWEFPAHSGQHCAGNTAATHEMKEAELRTPLGQGGQPNVRDFFAIAKIEAVELRTPSGQSGHPGVRDLLTPCEVCLLYTSPSPRDRQKSRMPSSA